MREYYILGDDFMKIFKWIKKYGKLIVGLGVSAVVTSLLKENISNEGKGFWKKMLLKIGISAIAGYAVTKVTDGFDDEVDELEKETKEIVKEFKEIDGTQPEGA
jgi:hypothetical protein